MKKIITACLLILLIGCSKDDEIMETEPEVIGTSFTLSKVGASSLNYASLSAVSYEGSSSILSNGNFELPIANAEEEELPHLITKDDEVLFGYYARLANKGEITLENILLFFFSLDPDIGLRGWEINELMQKIKSLSDKTALQQLISESLNNSESPFENINFVNLFQKNVKLLITTDETRGASKEYIQDFSFKFHRNGKIEVPTTVPLFAIVGVEIKNISSGVVSVENHLMKSKSLVLNTTSLADWIGTKLFPETSPPEFNSFQLTNNGIYEIKFTNGKGSSELDNFVFAENMKYGVTTVLGQVIPKGLGALYQNHTACFKAVMDLNVEIGTDLALWVAKPPSDEDVYLLIRKNIFNVAEIVAQCAMEGKAKEYLSILLKFGIKKLDLVKETSELTFWVRDFLASNISGKETRYYSNVVSFGTLRYENITGSEILGAPGENVFHYSKVIEAKTWYEVHRDVAPPYSRFEKNAEFKPAEGLPFDVIVGEGDSNVLETPRKTDSEGELYFIFELGSDELTKAIIQPDFNSFGMISPQQINIKVSPQIIGKWKLFELNGVKPGEYYKTYHDTCPEVETGEIAYHSDNLIFTEDGKFSRIATSTWYLSWPTVDENCHVTHQGQVQVYEDTWEIPDGAYKLEGNMLTIIDNSDGYEVKFPIQFLENGNLKFGSGNKYTIYERN